MTSRCSKGPLLLGLACLWAALGGLALATATPTTPTAAPTAGEDPAKAAQTVLPTEYGLDLQVVNDPQQQEPSYNLTGRVTITVTCRTPTDRLHLAVGDLVHVADDAILTTSTLYERSVVLRHLKPSDRIRDRSTLTGDQTMTVVRYPAGKHWISLQLPKTLKADHSYQLKLNFSRPVLTELHNKDRLYHVALMVPPGQAANYFPVFNASDYKAPFEVNVTHLQKYTSLGAAKARQIIKVLERPKNTTGDWVLTAFEKSQPITIRQLAILVGDFKLVNETSIPRLAVEESARFPEGWDAVVQRVWTRPNFARATVLAAQLLPEAACHIQCYVGVPFPSNTLDVVAMPYYSDTPVVSATVAFFRESDLQYDPNMDGLLLRLARVVAEQYLGVMVTPVPDSRAVSEALANYVASETVRTLRPREAAEGSERALLRRGHQQEHQQEHQQGHQQEHHGHQQEHQHGTTAAPAAAPTATAKANGTANGTCDCQQYESDKSDLLVNALYSVYYELGSQFPLTGLTSTQRPALQGIKTELIVRMLAITLGERTFKAALKGLLDEKKDGFFSSGDLWKLMTQHAYAADSLQEPLDVEAIVASWVDKDRFPLLSVSRDDHDNSAKLQQSVFRRRNYTPEERDLDKENAMVWNIPIVTLTEGQAFARQEHPPRLWMSSRTALLENASLGDSYLVVNPEETAPCIVNYDKRNWELLSNALNDRKAPELPPRTRAKLLHDAVMLAHAGALPFGDALPLLRSLQGETSPAVWMPVGNVLDHVRRDVEGTRLEDRFTNFLESILRGALRNVNERLSAPGLCDCEQRQLFETRALILQQLARADMQPCIKEARAAYEVWAASATPDEGKPMPDSLMCCLFQWGEDKEFEFGVQRLLHFPESRQRAERAYLLRVLAGCPRAPARKERVDDPLGEDEEEAEEGDSDDETEDEEEFTDSDSDEEVVVHRLMNITLLENNGTFSEEDQMLVLQMVSARGADLLNFLDVNWDKLKAKHDSQPFMWEHLVSRASGSLKTHDDLKKLRAIFEKRAGSWGIADGIVQQAIRRAESNVAWADEAFPSMEAWLEKYLVNIKKE
ncbi:Aminopeptidase-like protein AC3.5 [Frankliniella fusca]|uniref:Aminopeptidase-like protein AC3.5 n=1 Tax=Frankliniella fusca TaxID=407009 RepID=A0AAE1LB18_9NEOP|nr:Aminopeptidase-like protein AC3.5 [Frankliniella fusca]